jgi:hypothetical protein
VEAAQPAMISMAAFFGPARSNHASMVRQAHR